MRVFPEGSEGWLATTGKLFCVLAALGMVCGAGFTARQCYILRHWASTSAVVVESKLIRTRTEDGVEMCSAAYTLAYSVGGKDVSSEKKETSSSSDCQLWEAKVASAKGANWTVLYDQTNPTTSYLNPGFNLDFFLVPMWCLLSSTGFAVFGLAGWKIGTSIEKSGTKLP